VIVVLGRPTVHRPEPDGELAPGGLSTAIARWLVEAGASVELAGSIGDDLEGDRVIVELGRAGIGHAAVLRDPSAHTPSTAAAEPIASIPGRGQPRLEAADVELALGYLSECRVLVVADSLDPEALSAALRAAEYHGASVVIVADAGEVDPEELGDRVTLLERPSSDPGDGGALEAMPEEAAADLEEALTAAPGEGAEAESAFAAFVAEYALRLDRGEAPARAFEAALGDSAWEPAAG
jgi:sugar/nucleoside kinase (ribokinase family)